MYFSSQCASKRVGFVEKKRQMANKKLSVDDELRMLFADSESEGEYLSFVPGDTRESRATCCGREGAGSRDASGHGGGRLRGGAHAEG